MSRQHQPLQQRRRGKSLLTEFIEQNICNVVGRIQSYEIEQGERPHGIAAAKLHALVDVFDAAHTFFERANRIEQVRHQQSIYDETGPIRCPYRNFVETGGKFHGLLHHGRRRDDRADYLDELHQRHWIEKVHANEAVDAVGRRHHLRNRQRGRVTRKNRARLDDLVNRGIGFAFKLEIFRYRLDHHVAIGQLVEPRSSFQPFQRLCPLFRCDRSLFCKLR